MSAAQEHHHCRLKLALQVKDINPPMVKGGGKGDGWHPPNRFFQFLLRMVRAFSANQIFSCRLILGRSVHEKIFQIGCTVLALKLDKRVRGGGGQPL